MTPSWIVRSMTPPENPEEICCSSMLDAARAWAERQFRRGLLVRSGTDVLVHSSTDPVPKLSTYQVKLTIVNAPAFRASLVGVAYEGMGGGGDAGKGGHRGQP